MFRITVMIRKLCCKVLDYCLGNFFLKSMAMGSSGSYKGRIQCESHTRMPYTNNGHRIDGTGVIQQQTAETWSMDNGRDQRVVSSKPRPIGTAQEQLCLRH